MAGLRKRSIKTVGLALTSWALIGAQAGDDPAVIRSSHVLSNFIASARACGLELNDPPTMVVTTDPGIIFYQSRDNTVNVSRWQDMPPPLQWFRHRMVETGYARARCTRNVQRDLQQSAGGA